MSVLESLTDDQKQNAFERATLEANLSDGKLVRLTEEYFRVALDFARDHYNPDEPMTENAGVIWGPDVEEDWLQVFRQGFSLMLISEADGDVIAFRVTRMHQLEDDPYKLDQISDLGTRKVWAFVAYCDARSNVLEHFGVTEALHLVALAVNSKYRRKGIMRAALRMYQHLGVDPICIKGEASSNYSKKVYAKTGFTMFYDLPYVDYIDDGEQVFKNTGVHKSMQSFGQLLRAKKTKEDQTQDNNS